MKFIVIPEIRVTLKNCEYPTLDGKSGTERYNKKTNAQCGFENGTVYESSIFERGELFTEQ